MLKDDWLVVVVVASEDEDDDDTSFPGGGADEDDDNDDDAGSVDDDDAAVAAVDCDVDGTRKSNGPRVSSILIFGISVNGCESYTLLHVIQPSSGRLGMALNRLGVS